MAGGSTRNCFGICASPSVLHHPGVEDVGDAHAVELVKVLLLERARDLDGAVPAEVEEDNGVAVLNRADRLAARLDHEAVEILVGAGGVLPVVGLHGLAGGREMAPDAEHVRLPSALDDSPVRAVPVHRRHHAAAARRDPVVAAGHAVQLCQPALQGVDVGERASLSHVAAVEQRMQANAGDALLRAPIQQREQVLDVTVDIAVREQPDEVDRPAGLPAGDGLLPGGAREDRARGDRVVHQLRALGEDPAGAQRVVPDLGVAHVLVRREADRLAVRLQRDEQRPGEQRVEHRRIRQEDAVRLVALAEADAVHDDQDDRAGKRRETGERIEVEHS